MQKGGELTKAKRILTTAKAEPKTIDGQIQVHLWGSQQDMNCEDSQFDRKVSQSETGKRRPADADLAWKANHSSIKLCESPA